MRTFMEEYNYWLESDVVDSATKEELRSIADNKDEIEGRFKAMLSFGTAGLRGTMKAGIANMNVYTVRYATQGLANLIIEKGGQIGGNSEEGNGVAIAYDSRNNSALFASSAFCNSILFLNTNLRNWFDSSPHITAAIKSERSFWPLSILSRYS